jgi:hypothetical protein
MKIGLGVVCRAAMMAMRDDGRLVGNGVSNSGFRWSLDRHRSCGRVTRDDRWDLDVEKREVDDKEEAGRGVYSFSFLMTILLLGWRCCYSGQDTRV